MDAQHLFDLEGSIALVTGGGTGIGLMAAKTLAANGAKVYITGRRQNVLDNAIATHGQGLRGSMAAVPGDISSKEDLARIASSITEKKLHILINNAGVEGPCTRLGDAPEKLSADEIKEAYLASEDFAAWDTLFRINTSSVLFSTMTLLPLLAAGNAAPPTSSRNAHAAGRSPWTASVVNITSISGQVKLNQNHYAYNASKAAANSLTMMMAHEFRFHADLDIRVNALAPGLFATEMTAAGQPSSNGVTDASQLGQHANPAGRVGDPEEMGSAILFLATNTFVTGQILAVDGGFVTAVPSAR